MARVLALHTIQEEDDLPPGTAAPGANTSSHELASTKNDMLIRRRGRRITSEPLVTMAGVPLYTIPEVCASHRNSLLMRIDQVA